jgi:1-deoxy-D-xylulose-5-phosphate reductoisomerase
MRFLSPADFSFENRTMKHLTILGSTGSIGSSTLEIVAAHPDRFVVEALTAGSNLDLFSLQIERFTPRLAVVGDEKLARVLASLLPPGCRTEIMHGVEGLVAAATMAETEMVVAAIVGAAGLVPTAAAIKAGKDIALANKETLVTAGHLFMELVEQHGVRLHPIDSEHSAVFQSMAGHRNDDIARIILTASGGPFLNRPLDTLGSVTVEEALNHPNWSMGKKITIDSATMMNKALEIIEAKWLFSLPPDRISVHIHPQSIIHSMVEYLDGSVIAQLGTPDMKAPIAYALSWPERIATGVKPLDLTALSGLTFSMPDPERFPALRLACRALADGESMPAVMNAANELAVEAFLQGEIPFADVTAVTERVMDRHEPCKLNSIADVLEVDLWSRVMTRELLTV